MQMRFGLGAIWSPYVAVAYCPLASKVESR